MKRLTKTLIASVSSILFLLPLVTFAAYTISQGGTGASTPSGAIANIVSQLSDIDPTTGGLSNAFIPYYQSIFGSGLSVSVQELVNIMAANIGTINTGTTGQFPYYAANGKTLTATSSIFLATSGNVGFSTTTPTWTINPFSSTASQLALSAGAGVSQITLRNAGGNLYLSTTTVAGNATTTLAALTVIGSSGNTGIASTSPSAKFAVSGTTALGTTTVYGDMTFYSNMNRTISVSSGTVGRNLTIAAGSPNNMSVPGVLNLTGGSGLAVGGNVYAYGGISDTPGNIILAHTGSVASGNVGVATTTPQKQLSVAGDIELTGGLFDSLYSSGSNGMVLQTTGSATKWVATSTLGFSPTLTGTTGQVAYFNGTNTVVGTSSLFLATSGNVGISNTSPMSKLSIIGPNGSTAEIIQPQGTDYDSVRIVSVDADSQFGGNAIFNLNPEEGAGFQDGDNIFNVSSSGIVSNSTAFNIMSGSNGTLTLGATGATFNINGIDRVFMPTNGNFGIGSSSPFAKLSVTGSGTGTGVNFQTTNSSHAPLVTLLDNGKAGFGTTSPDSAFSQSSNTTGTNFHIVNSGVTNAQTLAIDFNGGNVGASTEDAALVRVNSQSSLRPLISMNTLNKNRFQVSAKGVTIVNNSDFSAPTVPNSFLPSLHVHTDQVSGSRPLFFGYDNAAGTGYAAYMTVGSCGSFFQMCLDMGSSTTQYAALTSFGNNLAIGGVSGATGFSIADGNAVNIFFGNTGNTLIPNGRTGVGTTTPFGTLSVTGTSTIPSLVVASSSNATQLIVTAAGNVGIGTAAPLNKLSIMGDAPATAGAWNEGQLEIFGASNSNKRLQIGVDTSSGVMASYLQSVEVGGAVRPINLNPQGGQVAVGALPPSFAAAVFTVAANSNYSDPLTWASTVLNSANTSKFGGMGYDANLTSASANGSLFIQGFFAATTANIPITLAPIDGDVYIGKDGAAQKLILPSSILGIGTKTPGARLEIVGTTTVPTAVLFNVASSSANSYLNVQSTGNVGIGTSTPVSKLTVNGDIGTDGAIPALTSAGTGAVITIGSTDTAGEITEGTLATGATITFATAKARAPFCVVTSQSGLQFQYTISSSAITVTNIGALSSTKLNYHCIQNNL